MVLFTDTDCDITPEIAKKYNFQLISMPYIIDGEEVYPYKSWDTFDSHGFYQMLRERKTNLPTTCGISEENYREYFEPWFAKGEDIFYVHFSAAMTKTFDSMHAALDKLKEKYPERKFYEVDAKGITIGAYNIVVEIGDMFLKGKTVEEVLKWAETEVDKFAIYFFADDLKFFHKSGRVKGLSAFMGGLVGVRPIINMDSRGVMDSVGKALGRKNALNALIDKVKELGDEIKAHRIVISSGDAPELEALVEKALKVEFGYDLWIEHVLLNPTAGAHCGPDGVGISFHAKHR